MLRAVDLARFPEFGRPFLFLYAKAMLTGGGGMTRVQHAQLVMPKARLVFFFDFLFLKIE